MDAATRGITKAGTSENTMRVRVDDDFLHQELLDLNETIRDYHRLTMYFPNKTRLIYGEWYGKCLGMGVHTVVFGIFLYRWWLSPPMNEKNMPKPVQLDHEAYVMNTVLDDLFQISEDALNIPTIYRQYTNIFVMV